MIGCLLKQIRVRTKPRGKARKIFRLIHYNTFQAKPFPLLYNPRRLNRFCRGKNLAGFRVKIGGLIKIELAQNLFHSLFATSGGEKRGVFIVICHGGDK